jgi:hypothetical protein
MDTKRFKAKPGKRSRKLRGIQFPGITADAEALKCDRTHLFRVLTGERTSKSLTARYRELKAQQQEVAP